MLLEKIAIGKTLEIEVDREGYRYHLVSKVEKTGIIRVCVTAIKSNGITFNFRPKDEIRLVYRDEHQMWEWTKVKAGTMKLDGEMVHYFDIINKGQSFNRRNAFRVILDEDVDAGFFNVPGNPIKAASIPMVKEVQQIIYDEEGNEVEKSQITPDMVGKLRVEKKEQVVPMTGVTKEYIHINIKDVSENGIGIFTNTKLNIDDGFFVGIPSSYGELLARAKVVRSVELKGDRKYRYYYGCTYTESDKRIILYIYDIQRKLIKKRKEKEEFEASMRAKKGR